MIKEEPLSEEDLRAIQKDRQKKDNHNMSKYMHIHKYFRTQGRSFLEHTIFWTLCMFIFENDDDGN